MTGLSGLLERIAGGPERPRVDEPDLGRRLDQTGASGQVRTFCRSLADDGLATLDLGVGAVETCSRAVAETEPYFADGVTNRVQDAWRRSAAVRRLATDPALLEALRTAYGREPAPFQTLNFLRGSQQEIHADSVHFHCEPAGFMCGAWIALEDIAADSGPLLYVPGSHKLPDLRIGERRHPTLEEYNTRYVPEMARRVETSGLPVKSALLKKGQALVWAANLAHGGGPIINPAATRRSLVVHFYFEGCTYYTPMYSEVEKGRLSLRLPANVRTGGWTWPRRGVRPLWPGWTTVRTALADRRLRRVYTF